MKPSTFMWILLNLVIPFDILVKNGRTFFAYLIYFIVTSLICCGIYTANELGGETTL